MTRRAPHPRPKCWRCEDWTTVLTSDGKRTIPCPECSPKARRSSPSASYRA